MKNTLQEQLEHIKSLFRNYQLVAYDKLLKATKARAVLDADMGSGKTLIGLSVTFSLEPERVLILCSKNALFTWRKELNKWFKPWANYQSISGKRIPADRKKLWQKSDVMFTACTYATFKNDFEWIVEEEWDVIICDEYHKSGLRNSKTKMSQMAKAFFNGYDYLERNKQTKKLIRKVKCPHYPEYIIPLTGTPTSKGVPDLWAILNCLNPQKFKSYWSFINKFCYIHKSNFGTEIKGVKDAHKLREYISSNYVRISRKITDEQLPPKQREPIIVEVNDAQLTAYKNLAEEMMLDLGESLLLTPTTLARDVRLRQLLACPKLLGINDYGVGIETVYDMMTDIEDYHGVIFTVFTKAIPHYKEYLDSKLKGKVDIQHLWGGMEPDEVAAATKAFRDRKGIMLCSTKFSQSFDLETAKRCWHIAYDYDPTENAQAESRLRRASSTMDPIMSYYIKHLLPDGEVTIDDRCMEVLSDKHGMNKDTFRSFNEET